MGLFFSMVSKQLSRPEGLSGRLLSILMSCGNARMYEIAYRLLDIRSGDHLLEIGFGNGKYLAKTAGRACAGFVAGIDISNAMVHTARRRNANFLRSAKMEIKKGNIASIPYGNCRFDKVYSLNTIYFWQNPEKDLREIFRVMKPGAALVLGMNTRAVMEKSGYDPRYFTFYDRQEVEMLLAETGFTGISAIHEKMAVEDALCIRAEKPSKG